MSNDSWLNASIQENNSMILNGTIESDSAFTTAEYVAVKSLLALSSVLGTVENIIVFIAIRTSETLLDIPSNWFVLSLALADALLCIFALPHLCSKELFGMGIFQALAVLTSLGSSGNLFILTFNRFLSVYDSLKYASRMTVTRAKQLVLVPWCLALFFAVTFGIVSLAHGGNQVLRYSWIAYYFLVSGLVIVLNGYMLKKAKDHHKTIKRQHKFMTTGQQKILTNEYLCLLRLIAVTMTFFVACISIVVFSFAYSTKMAKQSSSFNRSATYVYLAMSLNAMLDPLFYFISSQEFKRFMTKLKRYVFGRDGVNILNKNLGKHNPFVIQTNQVKPARR